MTQPRQSLSPCVGVCIINTDTHLCEGCFRTLDEIAGWGNYSIEQKKKIMMKTKKRRRRIADGTFFD
jgi:hypothetical protein